MKLAILTLVFCVAHLVANAKNNFKTDIKPWTIPKDKNPCTEINLKRCIERHEKEIGHDLKGKEKKQFKKLLKGIWCEVPREIANGKVKYSCGCGFGQMTKYRCNDGFVLVPKECRKRFCQWNRNWSGNDPICKADCGPLTAPPHGNVDFPDTLQGTMAKYTCDENYALSGSDTRVCGQDHKWTGTPAVCSRITCAELDDPTDGSVVMSGTSVTSIATYNCMDNYHLDGPYTRVCLKSGNWSGTEPTCEPFDCGLLVEETQELKADIQELKAKVANTQELKAEVQKLKADVANTHELKADMQQLKANTADDRRYMKELKAEIVELKSKNEDKPRTIFAQMQLLGTHTYQLGDRVNFTSAVANVGNAYDIHHGYFEAPFDGTYLFISTLCTSPNNWVEFRIVKDNNDIGEVISGDPDYTTCASRTVVTQMKMGSKVWVEIDQVSGGTINSAHGIPSFTGVFLNNYQTP